MKNGEGSKMLAATLMMDRRLLEPLLNTSLHSNEYVGIEDQPQLYREPKSRLIEMDRMQNRYHNPHCLSIGFIVDKCESPH